MGRLYLKKYECCGLVWKSPKQLLVTYNSTPHIGHFTVSLHMTPLAEHAWHCSCLLDGAGWGLSPIEPSLPTLVAVLGDWSNGLCTHCSCTAHASIFLTKAKLCEIVLPPHEERHCTTRLEVPGLIPGRILGNSWVTYSFCPLSL